MADLAIAALESQIAALRQTLAKRDHDRDVKRLEAVMQMQKLQYALDTAQAKAKELQRRKQHKQAKAGLASAKAQQAKVEHQVKKVKALQRNNEEKAAMMKDINHRKGYIRVLELPTMHSSPDWDGNTDWQGYQRVQQQVYKLDNGQLSKPSVSHIRLRRSEDLFARGGFRYVYYAQTDSGERYVAKRLYAEGDELEDNIKDVEADIKDHLTADRCICDFHRRAKKAHASTASMHFTSCVSLIIVKAHDSAPACGSVVYFLERVIEGDYCKWIQNNGDINAAPSVSGQEVLDTTQAMVHFSYEMSLKKGRDRRYMITDIQGFQLASGSTTLIDPAICRPRVCGARPVGADYGIRSAANAFFRAHRCSHICRALKLDTHEP
ncbi:TPA: hypothetical protein ACH3X2_002294 [Trebouxia sp. C0005]